MGIIACRYLASTLLTWRMGDENNKIIASGGSLDVTDLYRIDPLITAYLGPQT
jgi:hypothetical protein